MKISFAQIRKLLPQLTAIDTPFGGAEWKVGHRPDEVAEQLINYLEDRRILYVAPPAEDFMFSTRSVQQIRERLGADMDKVDRNTRLGQELRTLQAACRAFLTEVAHVDPDLVHGGRGGRDYQSRYEFFRALVSLRRTFAIGIARLVSNYEIDVEAHMAQMIREYAVAGDQDIETQYMKPGRMW